MMALTGCSSGTAEAESSSAPQSTNITTAAPNTAVVVDKNYVAETTQNPDVKDNRDVTVVKVLDLNHIEVTPAKSTDDLFGETFTVAVPGYKGPAQGACGFDEALTFAKGFYVVGNDYALKYARFGGPLAQIQDGEHVGNLNVRDAETIEELEIKNPVGAGYAVPDLEKPTLINYENNLKFAQEKQSGLHALCPGFGQ